MALSENSNGSPLTVLKTLSGGEARDLRTLQGRLTFVGSQKKSVPSLVFTTFHHLARMDWFLAPKTGPKQADDDSLVWHFTTTPDEMKSIVDSLARLGEVFRDSGPPPPRLSFAMALKESRLGDLAFEATLDTEGSKAVFDAIRENLDSTNGFGRAVMDLHRPSIFGAQ
jgi:hypothetical protein